MANKILLTGSSGFVGENLKSFLHRTYGLKTINARFHPKQQFQIDEEIIIHLAGKAHDLKNVNKPSDYYEANFELTKQLFDAFLISKARKFVFMSSVKSTADVVENVLTEDNIPNPQTIYGKSKLAAEEYINNQQLGMGKKVYILRPCMIHGPGNKGNLNLLFQFVAKGIPYPLGGFQNKRSFLSIGNLCYAINHIL
ncbi:MAG: NAD-dependent epimerase/dehydratase family protein [Chitinophagaceae bacterium]